MSRTGDDHENAGVHHAWILNRNLEVQTIGLAGLSIRRVPLGQLALD